MMNMRAITKHQMRVLAALLAIERSHDHRWWTRDAIGAVVQAGGYHAIIQTATMEKLRACGFVQLEAESWTPEVRQLVRCNCACHNYGLTDDGRALAESCHIRLSEDNRRAIEGVSHETINWTDRHLSDGEIL